MIPATEIIVPIALFALIFGIVYVIVTARHRQRMALIAAGRDPNLLRSYVGLTLAFLSIGTGCGLAIGWAVHALLQPGEDNPAAWFISVLVCGGVSMLLAHRHIDKERKLQQVASSKG
ncbi:MAG: hypothetical protein JNL05_03430 [Flavobacteriales bacterium]|nr:hypothetical protein [Flavobacteriales bacterium]